VDEIVIIQSCRCLKMAFVAIQPNPLSHGMDIASVCGIVANLHHFHILLLILRQCVVKRGVYLLKVRCLLLVTQWPNCICLSGCIHAVSNHSDPKISISMS